MKLGFFWLLVAYVLSQFYRAFLAVMAPELAADLGASTEDLADASGYWFLAFAAMQIPVGWALDRIGPRRTASVLLALGGGGGAALFALADGPGAIKLAMILIGIGCSPVLMASYFIFARVYAPKVFATLAGAVIGIGSLGNLASALPLALAMEAFGWRGTIWALAGVTLLTAGALLVFVRDPERIDHAEAKGSVLSLLAMPALWPIIALTAVNYAPAAGVRGLWAGPYLADVFSSEAAMVGTATLIMGGAMVLGNFAYGPLDRMFGTRKWVAFAGNAASVACLGALALMPQAGLGAAVLLLAAIGLFGSSYPLLMAHGRAFFPAHLTGRGVTLMNLFSIGGVGVMQFVSGTVHGAALAANPGAPEAAYGTLFAVYAGVLAVGLMAYLFSRDNLG